MSAVTRYGEAPMRSSRGESLADVLERVLDKGVVIAGDVVVNILDIELLTLKLRLIIASAETAKEMGIDWWEDDPFLSSHAAAEQAQGREALERENAELRARLDRLERVVGSLPAGDGQHREAPDAR